MNARALVVAANLVESGLYLRACEEHPSLDVWISRVAGCDPNVLAAWASLASLIEDEDAQASALRLSAAYGRAAYQLGVQVGLRLRTLEEPTDEASTKRAGAQRR